MSKVDKEVCGKGIMWQIEQRSKTEPMTTLPTKQQWKTLFEQMDADRREHIEEMDRQQKENFAHLTKRSKELGKPIPLVLQYIMCAHNTHMVGSDFVKTYKEWL
jgi:hypothetical protein